MSWLATISELLTSDGRELRRKRNQLQIRAIERAEARMSAAWEAADRDRIRGDRWMVSRLSATSAMEEDLKALWERSESLLRNDPYASAAINGRVDNVVGSGMTFHSRIRPSGDVISDSEAAALNTKRDQVFWLWAQKDQFYAKQRVFERSRATYGEGLAIMSDIDMADGRPIPLTWQVINPQRLETPPKHITNNRVRLGIQFGDAAYTGIEGYWIRNADVGDTHNLTEEFTFYPKERVIHSFEQLTPGQIRGVPWLAPVMAKLKDLKDFSEAKLISEQVTACTTTFIRCEDPLGRAAGAATGTSSSGQRLQELEPGRIEYINENDTVQHVDPNRPGGTYAPFVEHHLMGVAAGLRYSYALLSKDFRSASFANGRLEMADARKTFECWQWSLISDCLMPLIERATKEMAMLGLLKPWVSAADYIAFPNTFNAHQIKPPRWRMAVNPKQENDADVVEVENLFASRTDKCDEREADFEDVIHAREREEIMIAEMESRIAAKRAELGLPPKAEQAQAQATQQVEVMAA